MLIKQGDVLAVLREEPSASFDACLTDPPYGLSKKGGNSGFMGKEWDARVPGVDVWKEVLRVLKPGAMLLAFGGTRTYHRLACAIEDAGFEIRDCCMWLYGSGFPKSHDISKGIDKQRKDEPDAARVAAYLRVKLSASGKSRTDIDTHFGTANVSQYWFSPQRNAQVPAWDKWLWLKEWLTLDSAMDDEVWRLNGRKGTLGEAWNEREVIGFTQGRRAAIHGGGQSVGIDDPITAPSTPEAQCWNGYGTALKPSFEPLIFASKPYPKEAERDIIVGSLLRLDSQLWSLLPANIAEKHFGLSRQEQNEVLDSAQWSAEESQRTRVDLFGQMDTSQFVTVMITCLSTVSSWSAILGASCDQTNTSTIATRSGPTIQYGTLKSCLLALTPRIIIQAAINQPGSWWNALPATRYLNAVAKSISGIQELSALEAAIEQGHTLRLDGIAQGTNFRPIVLAMKPLDGTYAENALTHGVAGLNIAGSRVGVGEPVPGGGNGNGNYKYGDAGNYTSQRDVVEPHTNGRWPANLLLDEQSAELLDQQSGESKSNIRVPTGRDNRGVPGFVMRVKDTTQRGHGDSGGASRFFKTVANDVHTESGPTRFRYVSKASKRDRGEGNTHPCVKPISLTEYLARLILPPYQGTQRRLLNCFCGSGSEMIGARNAGWEYVLGIEIDPEYVRIANKRLTPTSTQYDLTPLLEGTATHGI